MNITKAFIIIICVGLPLYCFNHLYQAIYEALPLGEEATLEASKKAAQDIEYIILGPPEAQIFVYVMIIPLLFILYRLKKEEKDKNEK